MNNKRLDLVFVIGFAACTLWTLYFQDWLLAGLSAIGFAAYLWRLTRK